jgi:hypothetical protein
LAAAARARALGVSAPVRGRVVLLFQRCEGLRVDQLRAQGEAAVQRRQRARARRGLGEARDGAQQELALGGLERRLQRLRHQVQSGLRVALRERAPREACELEIEAEDGRAQDLHLVDRGALDERHEQRAPHLAVPRGVLLFERLPVLHVRALRQVLQRRLDGLDRLRPALAALLERGEDRGRVPRVVDVVRLGSLGLSTMWRGDTRFPSKYLS